MNIFVSFAFGDREWANKLVSSLRGAGFEVDGAADDLQHSDSWETSLRRLIDSADLVISVLTPHSLQSPWMLFELGAARAARRQVLSLLVTKTGEPFEIPRGITGNNFLRAESPQEAAEQVRQYVSEQMAAA